MAGDCSVCGEGKGWVTDPALSWQSDWETRHRARRGEPLPCVKCNLTQVDLYVGVIGSTWTPYFPPVEVDPDHGQRLVTDMQGETVPWPGSPIPDPEDPRRRHARKG